MRRRTVTSNTDILRKSGASRAGDVRLEFTYDGVAAASSGLDLEMRTGEFMNRKNLLLAVQDGRVKQQVINEKIRHILHTAARFGWMDREQTDLTLSKYNRNAITKSLWTRLASIVLLKNERQLLPLDKNKIKSLLVVGPMLIPAQPVAGGSGAAIPLPDQHCGRTGPCARQFSCRVFTSLDCLHAGAGFGYQLCYDPRTARTGSDGDV